MGEIVINDQDGVPFRLSLPDQSFHLTSYCGGGGLMSRFVVVLLQASENRLVRISQNLADNRTTCIMYTHVLSNHFQRGYCVLVVVIL